MISTLNFNENQKQLMVDMVHFFGRTELTRKELKTYRQAINLNSSPNYIVKNEACKSATRGLYIIPVKRLKLMEKMQPSETAVSLKSKFPGGILEVSVAPKTAKKKPATAKKAATKKKAVKKTKEKPVVTPEVSPEPEVSTIVETPEVTETPKAVTPKDRIQEKMNKMKKLNVSEDEAMNFPSYTASTEPTEVHPV